MDSEAPVRNMIDSLFLTGIVLHRAVNAALAARNAIPCVANSQAFRTLVTDSVTHEDQW